MYELFLGDAVTPGGPSDSSLNDWGRTGGYKWGCGGGSDSYCMDCTFPSCPVFECAKCQCHSIWLVALQATSVSTVMKHTLYSPWLGRSFHSLILLLFYVFLLLFTVVVLQTEWCTPVELTIEITEQREILKQPKILSMQPVWGCAKTHPSLVTHSAVHSNLEKERES